MTQTFSTFSSLLYSMRDTSHSTIYINIYVYMCIYTYDADILCKC